MKNTDETLDVQFMRLRKWISAQGLKPIRMSEASRPAIEYETFQVETGGQNVLVTWFPPHDVPEGKRHGSGGIGRTVRGNMALEGT